MQRQLLLAAAALLLTATASSLVVVLLIHVAGHLPDLQGTRSTGMALVDLLHQDATTGITASAKHHHKNMTDCTSRHSSFTHHEQAAQMHRAKAAKRTHRSDPREEPHDKSMLKGSEC